jgi:hypothetical protein
MLAQVAMGDNISYAFGSITVAFFLWDSSGGRI